MSGIMEENKSLNLKKVFRVVCVHCMDKIILRTWGELGLSSAQFFSDWDKKCQYVLYGKMKQMGMK